MPTDEMFDLLHHDAAWGHAMARDADGLELQYVRRGHGSPAVLLLHGWPGFWYDWRRVLPRLGQITSVIAMDLRGFGASAKPAWPAGAAYSAEAHARNVLALLDQLHLETVVLVGYDIGSRVAQTVAQLEPSRVQALALAAESTGPYHWPLSLARPPSCGERLTRSSRPIGPIDCRTLFPSSSVCNS